MDRKLKLIWDFKGPHAKETAAHHLIHLNEFIARENINSIASGTEVMHDTHHIAYLALAEKDMPPVRDALKPHRGQLWMEQ